MPFDWNEFLTLAKALSRAVSDEASLRSAVSRSYYSAFKLAMERAELNGYRDKFDETGVVTSFYGTLQPQLQKRRMPAPRLAWATHEAAPRESRL